MTPILRRPRTGTLVLSALLWVPMLWWLAACTPAQQQKALTSPAGQLFCKLQMTAGPSIIVAVANAAAAQAMGATAAFAMPVAVLAEGATKAFVDQACTSAAAVLAARAGVPVPPPATAVPVVPIVPPVA